MSGQMPLNRADAGDLLQAGIHLRIRRDGQQLALFRDFGLLAEDDAAGGSWQHDCLVFE